MVTHVVEICFLGLYPSSHHHNEHNQGLGLKTCSFKAQGALGVSIFV
jgi:hypothetical protein